MMLATPHRKTPLYSRRRRPARRSSGTNAGSIGKRGV
jgi:hypothetical protein